MINDFPRTLLFMPCYDLPPVPFIFVLSRLYLVLSRSIMFLAVHDRLVDLPS